MTPDIWFTSDYHLNHKNIIAYCDRPFSSIDEMNEEIISRHNALVKPDDIVIDVGDFSMNEKIVESSIKRLNGHRTLVPGNHDRCYRKHGGSARWQKQYIAWGFDRVVQQHSMMIAGQDVLIDHMPYVADERHAERYAAFRPKDEGRWLLHGHVHGLWGQRGRMLNVGVDVRDFRPMHIDEIAVLIK